MFWGHENESWGNSHPFSNTLETKEALLINQLNFRCTAYSMILSWWTCLLPSLCWRSHTVLPFHPLCSNDHILQVYSVDLEVHHSEHSVAFFSIVKLLHHCKIMHLGAGRVVKTPLQLQVHTSLFSCYIEMKETTGCLDVRKSKRSMVCFGFEF